MLSLENKFIWYESKELIEPGLYQMTDLDNLFELDLSYRYPGDSNCGPIFKKRLFKPFYHKKAKDPQVFGSSNRFTVQDTLHTNPVVYKDQAALTILKLQDHEEDIATRLDQVESAIAELLSENELRILKQNSASQYGENSWTVILSRTFWIFWPIISSSLLIKLWKSQV